MATDYDKFLAEVLTGLPDDRKAAIEGTLKDETVAGKIRERVLARSDYSRNMDSLKSEREKFQREVAEAQQKITGWSSWYEQASKAHADLTTKVQRYRDTYGDIEEGQVVKPQVESLTKDEIEARLQEAFNTRDAAALEVADVMTELKLDYRDRFKEKLNMKELLTYAQENRLPLAAAYDSFIRPKAEEAREAELQKRIDAAREEGRKEVLSTARFPVAANWNEPHPLDSAEKAPKTSRDRVAAAVEGWNSAKEHSIY